MPREDVYVTNAVKHFRFTERGKRRIHATPQVTHIKACRPWLEAELTLVDPALIVCLGAVAARSLLGTTFRVTQQRGQVLELRYPDRRPAGVGNRASVRSVTGSRRRPERGVRWARCRPAHRAGQLWPRRGSGESNLVIEPFP